LEEAMKRLFWIVPAVVFVLAAPNLGAIMENMWRIVPLVVIVVCCTGVALIVAMFILLLTSLEVEKKAKADEKS